MADKPRGERRTALSTPVADYDSPWKDALDEYLEPCFALFFPEAHREIDWSHPHLFFDTELRKAVHDGETGLRRADRLVRVWLRNGRNAWVMIHIEVQGTQQSKFAHRMFVYNYRLHDYFKREIVSLAVLADERVNWRPDEYAADRWGCSTRFHYPVVKLTDWREKRPILEASENPFATVILAHLAAQDTRGDLNRRRDVKIQMIRRLYARGYTRERALSLLRFIDWLLTLPSEIEELVEREIAALEEGQHMAYVTSWERMATARGHEAGREAGREEGKRQAVRQILKVRFVDVTEALEQRISAATETELDDLLNRALVVASIDDV